MAVTYKNQNNDVLIQGITIASGAALSEELAVPAGMVVVGIIPAASWDGGNITLKEAHTSGGTYYTGYDCGDASTAAASLLINTPVASVLHHINPSMMIGSMGFFKVACGSNVGADREIIVVMNRTSL